MFEAILALLEAAVETLLPISPVVAACSSTALAIKLEISLILIMMEEISSIETIAPLVSA